MSDERTGPKVETNSQPDWVPIAQATGITGRSERTLRRWVQEDRIPHTRDGRRILVDVSMYRQATPGIIMAETGVLDMQARVSNLQNQVEMLQGVIDRQDSYIQFLQEMLREQQPRALPEPRKFRWPWQKE